MGDIIQRLNQDDGENEVCSFKRDWYIFFRWETGSIYIITITPK